MSEAHGFQGIQNRDRARQIISFEGMQLGKRMWPTDFDAVIDWHDVGWLVFEVKMGDKDVPLGQKKALERFVTDMGNADKFAVAVIAEHDVQNAFEDVILANCRVREVYKSWKCSWNPPKSEMTAGDIEHEFVKYVESKIPDEEDEWTTS